MKKPIVLAILDGMGLREDDHGNAVNVAKKPNFDRFKQNYSYTTLRADGEVVGLPAGQMGNSEVGHTNIGAGRIVYQSLALINNEIKTGNIRENEILNNALDNAKNNSLHLMGLLSDGGVHAHIEHTFELLKMAKSRGIKNVYLHVFMDGRDVDPKSGLSYIKKTQEFLEDLGVGKILTVSGRYYAMDRDKRWDRVALAYDAVVNNESEFKFSNPYEYVEESYKNGTFDEFIKPAVCSELNVKILDNDSVIFTNFRPDRASQLSGVLTNAEYNPNNETDMFKPNYRPLNLNFVQMMKYSNDVIGNIAYVSEKLDDLFGDVVSSAGLTQVRIAETEKYPHVTFFFDGGIEKELKNSKQILINSPKVATYDLMPEMSAYKVKDALIDELKNNTPDVVILNFANPDMVGHSGMLEPTVKSIEVVDECIGEIFDLVISMGGSGIITADHGNAELVLNNDESPNTAHTINPVPCIVLKKNIDLRSDGILADIAPTLLNLLNIDKPSKMTGKSVIKL